MRHRRIDYRLARRALLRDVLDGMRAPEDVCDAHPDLVRAGRNIGEPLRDPCPICHDEDTLRQVTYAFFGSGPARRSGRAVSREAVFDLTKRYGDVGVYVVEVCAECRWHHLLESYWVAKRAVS